MSHKVETMAYARDEGKPWHGLGFPVSSNLTPAQMLKAAKLDWQVEKRPVSYAGKDGTPVVVPDKYAIVRATDDKWLSMCGKMYKPIQNAEIMDFFTRFVKAGKMSMDTAGSLDDGRFVWALAKINKSFEIGKGSTADPVEGYLLVSQPHVAGNAAVIMFTPIRVVCWNTLTWALGASVINKYHGAGRFRIAHSISFTDDVKKQAAEALGLATNQLSDFEKAAKVLATKKATKEQVKQYFADVLEWDPKKAKAKAKEKGKEIEEPRALGRFMHALEQSPGADLPSAAGKWWGALNAVTYVVDHQLGRTQDNRLRSAWFGSQAQLKHRALDLALQRAK